MPIFKGHKQINFQSEICLIRFKNKGYQTVYIDSGRQADKNSFALQPYSTQTLYYPGIGSINLFAENTANIDIECRQALKSVISLDVETTPIKVDFNGIANEITIVASGSDISFTPNMSFNTNKSYHVSDGTTFKMSDCPIAFLYVVSTAQSHVEILAGR